MARFVDAIITYRILRMLTTSFTETDAYRLGIIDAHGTVIRKEEDLGTEEERESFTLKRCWCRISRVYCRRH